MSGRNKLKLEEPNIHIGKIIKNKMDEDGRKKRCLMILLKCGVKAINAIYENSNIMMNKLVKISLFLKYNFFIHYKDYVTQHISRENAHSLPIKDIENIDETVINEEINIGELIDKKMEEGGYKYSDLAKFLCISESPATRIHKKQHLDTYRLFNICRWLKFNLFIYYYNYVEKQLHERHIE